MVNRDTFYRTGKTHRIVLELKMPTSTNLGLLEVKKNRLKELLYIFRSSV